MFIRNFFQAVLLFLQYRILVSHAAYTLHAKHCSTRSHKTTCVTYCSSIICLHFSICRLSAEDFRVSKQYNADFVPVDMDLAIQKKRKAIESRIQEAWIRYVRGGVR